MSEANTKLPAEAKPRGRRGKQIAAAAAVLLFLGAGVFFSSGRVHGGFPVWQGFPLDDSYIHLVYADSLARLTLEYNPGVPEAGMTSLLWVLLEAPFVALSRAVRVSPVIGVHVLTQLLFALLVVVAAKWAHGLQAGPSFPFLAAVALMFEPALGFSRFSGMEVILTAGSLLAAAWLASERRYLGAGVWLALATLARPESVILTGLAVVAALFDHDRWKNLARLLGPSLLAAAVWVAIDLNATGRPLPNTFYAKSHLAFDPGEVWRILRLMVFRLPYFRFIFGFGLYLAGAWLLLKKLRRRALPLVGFPWLFIVGIACSRDLVSYWPYYFHRYFQPCIPFLVLPWAYGGYVAARQGLELVRAGRVRSPAMAAAGAGMVMLLVSVGPWPGQALRWRGLLAGNTENIREIQVTLGKWVANNTPPEAVIATVDAGAVRFFGERLTIDLVGLNTHEMLGGLGPRLLEFKPDYLILPSLERNPPSISGTWFEFKVGGGKPLLIRPVFHAEAERYTATEDTFNRQVIYEVSPENR